MPPFGPLEERREELRGESNRLLGWVEQRTDGVMEVRDGAGKLKGFYDPRSNETRDASGKRLGKGNLLAILLVQ